MKGTRDRVKRHRLTKKAGSVKYSKAVPFKFSKGSTHMFKVYGPELGDIKSIVLEVNILFMSYYLCSLHNHLCYFVIIFCTLGENRVSSSVCYIIFLSFRSQQVMLEITSHSLHYHGLIS